MKREFQDKILVRKKSLGVLNLFIDLFLRQSLSSDSTLRKLSVHPKFVKSSKDKNGKR